MSIFWGLYILWCAFFGVWDASRGSYLWAIFQFAFMIFGIEMLFRSLR